MTADWFVWWLAGQYTGLALCYAAEGNWPKCLYFIGSTVLTVGVAWMK